MTQSIPLDDPRSNIYGIKPHFIRLNEVVESYPFGWSPRPTIEDYVQVLNNDLSVMCSVHKMTPRSGNDKVSKVPRSFVPVWKRRRDIPVNDQSFLRCSQGNGSINSKCAHPAGICRAFSYAVFPRWGICHQCLVQFYSHSYRIFTLLYRVT